MTLAQLLTMNSVRAIQKLNQRELEQAVPPEASWHTDYRDTAFIYIGGLPFELNEGDIVTIFSQYGVPVWIRLARDRETGKSRGFAWLKYEDQRSCDLAVDNLGGATVMDRVLRVDHTRYQPKEGEDMRDNTRGEPEAAANEDSDGGRKKRRRTESESDSDDDRLLLPEEIELEKALRNLDEEDPMKESLVKGLQEKADRAVKKYKKNKRKEQERERRHERRHRRGHSPRRDRSREHNKDRRKIKDYDSEEEGKRRDRDCGRDGERRRTRHGDSEDEDYRKSSRRYDNDSRDEERVRDKDREGRDRRRRDDSRDRRRYSSDEGDSGHHRSRRSPS